MTTIENVGQIESEIYGNILAIVIESASYDQFTSLGYHCVIDALTGVAIVIQIDF
jgi:hypothetical protein